MKSIFSYLRSKLLVDFKLILIYCIVFYTTGVFMNWFGTEMEIARFTYNWQIITVYILYMVPVSLLLRGLPLHTQYAFGLVAIGLLEFSGYALGTSYAYPGNILDYLFGPRNFALAMSLFFALYFPFANWLVSRIYSIVIRRSGVTEGS